MGENIELNWLLFRHATRPLPKLLYLSKLKKKQTQKRMENNEKYTGPFFS